MPLYHFKCPECLRELDIPLRIHERDHTYCCEECRKRGRVGVRLERVPTAASFTITGFNAKNGYSK